MLCCFHGLSFTGFSVGVLLHSTLFKEVFYLFFGSLLDGKCIDMYGRSMVVVEFITPFLSWPLVSVFFYYGSIHIIDLFISKGFVDACEIFGVFLCLAF